MATKLKKPAAAPKDVAVPSPPRSNSGDTPPTSPNHTQKVAPTTAEVAIPAPVTTTSVPVKKATSRKAATIRKTVQLKVKGKRALKINPKNLARVLIENGKVKNGEKDRVVVKRAARKPRTPKEIKKELIDDEEAPPVLEPILAQNDDAEAKRTPKKRGRKSLKLPQLVIEDVKTIKQEPVDAEAEEVKVVRKIGRPRKIKVEPSSGDHLSYLMDIDQIKKESSDDFVEPNKVLIKRQRDFLESLETDSNKKENIENSAAFRKLDAAEVRVIDRLDLNVQSFKTDLPLVKRRHSIAKFPVTVDGKNDGAMPQLSVFTQIPRSLSPKASRRSMRTSGKKSPYTTRSDSPAHLLRNGKHRRLKDSSLLDGLESPKRRKRVHSDKLSECESDSSFSDLASLPGGDKEGDLLKTSVKDTIDSPMMSQDEDAAPSPQPVIDTNSNVCAAAFQQAKPSEKLPEKGLLLDIMKQTFNDLPLARSNDEARLKSAIEQEQQALVGTANCTFTNKIAVETTEEVELRRILAETDDKIVTRKVKMDDLEVQAGTLDQAPVLEKEDTIPVIDNIAALEPPQNSEHLDPPHLESNVPSSSMKKSELRRTSNDDHKIGISVTEMDNIVLFSIKHLPDDGDEHETSTEDNSGQKMETSKEDNKDNPVEEEPDVPVPKAEDGEVMEEPQEHPPQPFSDDISEKDNNLSEKSEEETLPVIEESPEQLAQKENILNALGLFAASVAPAALSTPVEETVPAAVASTSKDTSSKGYVAPVKIRIHKKKGKNSFKMAAHKGKASKQDTEASANDTVKHGSGRATKESSDTTGAHRKSHYSNRSNMEGSSEHTSDGEPADKTQPEKSLIVPEKASSFSIHPGRLCKDECSYCVGKFGLFDTPCHIAQIKSIDRQNKILAAEKQLTRDSCLCDACYRHVDRKANSPSYNNKSLKRNSLVAPGPRQNHCHVLGCNKPSTNILRRKWIIKMRKSIRQVINIDLDNPGLHSIPICDEHYSALEHLMICAMCKRRLSRNHIHYLGPEVKELNDALRDEDILITLAEKPVVCKLCKCFSSIILKDPEERTENSINFFKEYKKRLLHFNNVTQLEKDTEQEGPIAIPENQKQQQKEGKKETQSGRKKRRPRNSSNESAHSTKRTDGEDDKEVKAEEEEVDSKDEDCDKETRVRTASTDTNNTSENQSPVEEGDDYDAVDYNTLIPTIAMDCPSDGESKKELNGNVLAQIPQLESLGNAINISRTYKNRSNNDLAAQKLCQNPSISLKRSYTDGWSEEPPTKLISNPALSVRQLFPGEEELGLSGDIEFKNVVSRTPEGWAKCVSTIQYDAETKLLWEQLQKPYGSQSSFLRHLILLEKYFRNGDLVLSPTASHHAVNYRESVCNRLRAYDNIPSGGPKTQPLNVVQFNKSFSRSSSNNSNGLPPVTISQIGRSSDKQLATSKTPITIQQLTQPPLSLSVKNKANVALPELISLNQRAGSSSATRQQQCPSQKIKFPITKNWRPNLIPIDPAKKHERKPGLVQVVSSGKPYYITLEDYKKMCAIKRSFEAKQKKLLEQQQQQMAKQQQSLLISPNSLLKNKQHLSLTRTSGGTVYDTTKSKPSSTVVSGGELSESILQKLDKQVERLGLMAEHKALEKNPAIQLIPKIPKSLTVIPQTVRKPPSPVLLITAVRSASDNESQP